MRRIDAGAPLFVWDAADRDGSEGFAVATRVCANPECSCTEMWLDVRRAKRLADGAEVGGLALQGQVDADGEGLNLEAVKADVDPEMVARLRDQLDGADQRGWFQERWRRARGQVGDPAYPSGAAPSEVDGLVSFDEVFPYDFDVIVAHQGHTYLADDQYCLEPGCDCQEVVVQFIDVSNGGQHVGSVRGPVRRLESAEVQGPAVTRQLWTALLEQHEATTLRRRFRRMREVAARRRGAPAAISAKVPRNAPCPCGSGNKHKKCCGAVA